MSQRRPRLPGALYGALALTLAVVLAVISMSATQPPPPTIAEFAPQAREVIEDAPDEQSSAFGTADGGGPGGGTPAPTPVEDDRTVEVPRARRCVGDPPRQIEDPQSPPCVPFWEGDNGGATSMGVTGGEVKIFVPADDYNGNVSQEESLAMASFFSRRFELYGRRLTLAWPDAYAGGSAEDQQAMAAEVKAAAPFASLAYHNGSARIYNERVADLGVVAVTGLLGNDEWQESELAARRPYVWSYQMAADRILVNLGEWICENLAGGRAVHGGSDVSGSERVLGAVIRPWTDQDRALPLSPLHDELARCDIAIEETVTNPSDDAEGRINTILRLQEADVTSVLCLCNYFFWQQLMINASSQAYRPEWISSSLGNHDVNHNIKLPFSPPPEQTEHIIGLTFRPRQVTLENEPFWWAVSEGNPSRDGTRYNESTAAWNAGDAYRALLLVASGIQMAGPNLTPETFEAALMRTTFPNPDHPIKAGAVGFSGSHAMTIDGAQWWYSSTAGSPYPGDTVGSICYVDGGARLRRGAWDEGGRLREGPCDSGA